MSFVTNQRYAMPLKKKNFVHISANSQINNSVPHHKFNTLKEIHELIWQQIHALQEEGDCEEKKILLCRNVENYAGFGSNVHRYGVCMQVAYGLGRIFFIHQEQYSHFDGIFQWVQPESLKCGYLKQKILLNKSNSCNAQDPSCYHNNGYDLNNNHKVIEFNTLAKSVPYPRHIPGTLPEKLKKYLLSLGVKSPWHWFTSQFLAHLLLRPNLTFNKTLSTLKKKINFTAPIVGFHIRHGDKLTSREAYYINESEFVKVAREYFYENNITYKRIYIATDDIPAIDVVKKFAPEFQTTCLPQNYLLNGLGSYFQKNFSKEIIESTLVDLYLLTNTEYHVCDISSNLCRLVHALKQGSPPFKQDSIFKSVNKEIQFYYQWWGFIYPSSLWISTKKNTESEYKSKDGKIFKLLRYGIDLFRKLEMNEQSSSDFVYAQKLTNVTSERTGICK
ncbi:alpha-(1,6)-fucosyltransferase isoform X1 [Hydra vulgaris]|uniref:alpha-(1,6)-fucosyltransferase isoform X1 n=1 Tax=Hydra vulgaris TaxID=6087 RepID=UPI001F5E526E|nr:alpha-(1,6)-fucosyltransferase-like [Hydra vulgaris]